jgi:hypothetical protein
VNYRPARRFSGSGGRLKTKRKTKPQETKGESHEHIDHK